jgi:hypothetical protein
VVEDCATEVSKHAVPWLDRFESSVDIVQIDLAGAWRVPHLDGKGTPDPYLVGISAVDAGLYARARALLEPVYPPSFSEIERSYWETGIPVPDWVRRQWRLVRDLLGLVETADWEVIRQRLDECRAYTERKLRIAG